MIMCSLVRRFAAAAALFSLAKISIVIGIDFSRASRKPSKAKEATYERLDVVGIRVKIAEMSQPDSCIILENEEGLDARLRLA